MTSGRSPTTTNYTKMPTAKPPKKSQKKIRCKVCKKLFVPKRADIVTCSPSCSDEYHGKLKLEHYHKINLNAPYGKRTSKKNVKKKKSKKDADSFLDTKVDRRSDRSKIRDIMRSPESDTALSKTDKEAVERVMDLPYAKRWNGGAKDWTPAQRKYAQRIEIKKIASDFSSIMESNNRKDFGPPSLDELKKKKKADLPYKYDPLDDDTDSDDENTSAVNSSEESDAVLGDSTVDDDSGASDTSYDALATADDEIDATDEENQA